MYGWVFRHLPGPLWFRILLAVFLVIAAVLLLMEVIFPWLDDALSLTESTIGAGTNP